MNTHTETPFVSILICSLNGADRIGECLDSLHVQTYGKENFEIIVVDDGSTDDTSAVARARGAHVIRFDENKGRSTARNAAIGAAKGEIAVSIDDDCTPDPLWLEKLISVFQDKAIVAAGGKILALSQATIAQRYLEATGYGNPARAPQNNSGTLINRLYGYFSTMISPVMLEKEPIDVLAVYTANAGYRMDVLRQIGGFDETLKTSEDSDISARIHAGGGRIVYVSGAIVRHRHYESLIKVICESYIRAQNMLKFYLKQRRTPPIFPIPILYSILLPVNLLFLRGHIIVFVIVTLVLPIGLYGWWAVRAIRERRPEYVVYSYIQLIVESAVIVGLLKSISGTLLRSFRKLLVKTSGSNNV